MQGTVAFGVMLGTLLLFGASAWAKMAQTIIFTSTPPSNPVASGSYEVSASSSVGLPVDISTGGTCSFRKPSADEDERLEPRPTFHGVVEAVPSPVTVYFIAAGTCTIEARGSGNSEYEYSSLASQTFQVGKDPSEQITFTSAPPSDATVGGSYNPVVRLSAGIRVSFFTTTPSVCTIAQRHATVSLVGLGTCTIGIRQHGVSESEPPEAQQSFKVYATTSEVKKTRAKTKKHKKAKKCKKDQARKNGKCVKRMPASEARSATIIVRTVTCGVPELKEHEC